MRRGKKRNLICRALGTTYPPPTHVSAPSHGNSARDYTRAGIFNFPRVNRTTFQGLRAGSEWYKRVGGEPFDRRDVREIDKVGENGKNSIFYSAIDRVRYSEVCKKRPMMRSIYKGYVGSSIVINSISRFDTPNGLQLAIYTNKLRMLQGFSSVQIRGCTIYIISLYRLFFFKWHMLSELFIFVTLTEDSSYWFF